MTDIYQDFLNFQENGYEYTMEQISLQEEKMRDNKHIINVYYAFTSLMKMVENNDFSDNGVAFILVSNYIDYDLGNIINFTLLDINREPVAEYNSKGEDTYCQEKTKEILNLIVLEEGDELFCQEFLRNKTFEFALTKNGLDDFKNMLLCDRLRSTLSHLLLDTQMSEKVFYIKKTKI